MSKPKIVVTKDGLADEEVVYICPVCSAPDPRFRRREKKSGLVFDYELTYYICDCCESNFYAKKRIRINPCSLWMFMTILCFLGTVGSIALIFVHIAFAILFIAFVVCTGVCFVNGCRYL